MTQLLRPAPDLLGAGCWAYDWADLAEAGVALGPAQFEAFRIDDLQVVMIAWALPDPLFWTPFDPLPTPPLEFRCDVRGDVAVWRPTVPALAQVCWDLAEEVEATYGPVWRRFPSIPVRVMVPDDEWQGPGGSVLDLAPIFVRAWDLAVIPADMWTHIDNALACAWSRSTYAVIKDLVQVLNQNQDDCWLAVKYKNAMECHRHVTHGETSTLWRCLDGEAVQSQLVAEHLIPGTWEAQPFDYQVTLVNPDAQTHWEQLRTMSQLGAEQALLVAPPWEVAALRDDERKAGRPWG